MFMNQNKRNILFYILVSYILLQFIWWEVLLVKQLRQISDEKQKIEALSTIDASDLQTKIEVLEKQKFNKTLMIVGEGTVFLIILTLGVYRVYKSVKKEKDLHSRQKNFLFSITHELKSPLASSRLQLETLLKRELTPEQRQKLLNNSLNDIDRLNALVENLLLAAKLDAQNDLLNKEQGNLSDLVQSVYDKVLVVNTSHAFESDIEKNIFFNFDKVAFTSILINLLENAVKYSSASSKIKVNLKSAAGKITLSVADEGVGIDAKEVEKIFEQFYRVGNEETRNSKGTGLGLYIVKRLTQQHNGKVSVIKNGAKGSVFVLEFLN